MREWLMKYWLQVIFGAVITLISSQYKKKIKEINELQKLEEVAKKARTEELSILKRSMQAILRGQIIQVYNQCLDRGNICRIYEKENVDELYKSYHALGGNSVIEGVYRALMNMNTKKEEEPNGTSQG